MFKPEYEIGDLVEPVIVHRPDVRSSAFIFASPHSGRIYPQAFLDLADAPVSVLRRSEDAFVDHLFSHVPVFGAPLIKAMFPRSYVDPNRAGNELDPGMFSDVSGSDIGPPSARAAAGLGVVPRLGADGRSIHAKPIAYANARDRIDRFYRPYHAVLKAEIDRTLTLFDQAIVIDCHSMPAASARGADIVLGDRYGASCSRALVARAEAHFRALGFAVVRNRPYAGGYTTENYSNVANGVHTLQIEINRGLYMNERTVTPSAGMNGLHRALIEWTNRMIIPKNQIGLAAE